MLSGTFSGSAKRWAIVEKEAYAIIETCRRADYLLHRQDGFDLFIDHRNLRYIFDPHSVSNSVPKYTADKLHRWSLLLMGYDYDIHDIAGEDNLWSDLLSRWGSSFKTMCAIRQVPLPLSPQLDESFVWSTFKVIEVAQSGASPPSTMNKSTGDSLWRDGAQRIWIPGDSAELQMRVCIVGHFGIAGHRGVASVLFKELKDIESVSKSLQGRDVDLLDVRQWFDGLIAVKPHYSAYIEPRASIIHTPDFESGCVRVLRGRQDRLTQVEKAALLPFARVVETDAITSSGDENLSFVERIRKRRRTEEAKVSYEQLKPIPLTSNAVERFLVSLE
ncbi:hypothetical protein PHMEG_00013169 [Phytophthora megakarya]|uniref:Reverse transcriptase RNase H-like domain-containing protein n=1 Tax=Phytophthora megakarya TaxID=4795 RepID=A0A225W7C7_9STRA|nr:hypothetical protein PHMEG_00013169 [Phytophthora megakarya]